MVLGSALHFSAYTSLAVFCLTRCFCAGVRYYFVLGLNMMMKGPFLEVLNLYKTFSPTRIRQIREFPPLRYLVRVEDVPVEIKDWSELADARSYRLPLFWAL